MGQISVNTYHQIKKFFGYCLLTLCVIILQPQALYAFKIALFPIKTPHFNQKQQQAQMKSFSKQLKLLGGFEIIPLHLVSQVNDEIYGSFHDQKRQKELCETLQAELLVSTEMLLATQAQPALLHTQVIDCVKLYQQKRSLSFVGKLKPEHWAQACEQIEEMIRVIQQQSLNDQQNLSQSNAYFDEQGIDQNQGNHQGINHFNQGNQGNQGQIDQAFEGNSDQHPRLSRFIAFHAGISFFNQSLSYEASPKSRVQRSGIDFQSQWFSGYQLQLKFNPLARAKSNFKAISIELEYQAYQFETIQIIPIPRLFGPDEFTKLSSQLSAIRYGLNYAYPIKRQSVTHLMGIGIYGFDQSIEIGKNLDYRGHHYRYMQLQIFGQLSAANNKFLLGLDAYFIPFVSFDQSIKEFATQNQSIGGGFRFYMQYVIKNLVSMGLNINATLLSHHFSGEGRDGRIGLLASEQALQGAFFVGLLPF